MGGLLRSFEVLRGPSRSFAPFRGPFERPSFRGPLRIRVYICINIYIYIHTYAQGLVFAKVLGCGRWIPSFSTWLDRSISKFPSPVFRSVSRKTFRKLIACLTSTAFLFSLFSLFSNNHWSIGRCWGTLPPFCNTCHRNGHGTQLGDTLQDILFTVKRLFTKPGYPIAIASCQWPKKNTRIRTNDNTIFFVLSLSLCRCTMIYTCTWCIV